MPDLTDVPEFLQPSIGKPTSEIHCSSIRPISRAGRMAGLPVKRIGHAPLDRIRLITILSGRFFDQQICIYFREFPPCNTDRDLPPSLNMDMFPQD
jgi:hypothetical protein